MRLTSHIHAHANVLVHFTRYCMGNLPTTLHFLASIFTNIRIILSQHTYEAGRTGFIHPSCPKKEARTRCNRPFGPGPEPPGLGTARPTVLLSRISPAPNRRQKGLSSSLFDTGCLGTRIDRAVLLMSARQSVAAEGGEWRGWGCGAGSQHCTAVPAKDATQPGTHTGHPRRLRMTWDRPGGHGHFCLPQAHWSHPGSDPRGASRRWGSPLSRLFMLEGGSWMLLGGRATAPTVLLSPLSKDVTEGNQGILTTPTPDAH